MSEDWDFQICSKKVRCAVLTCHIGTLIPKDLLKILTRVSEEEKECPQLQVLKQTVFRERQTY